MAYPGGPGGAPAGPNVDFSHLLPLTVTLRRRNAAMGDEETRQALFKRLDPATDTELVRSLFDLLNYEITVGGDSYPFENEFPDVEAFKNYYCSHDCFVLVDAEECGADSAGENEANRTKITVQLPGVHAAPRTYDFGCSLIGAVHIKNNYPGRCSTTANGAFLVCPGPRNRRFGAATVLGELFPTLAMHLGYRVTQFNLVFEANAPSVGLWRKLCYPQVGRVEQAGRLVHTDQATGERSEAWSAAFIFSLVLSEENVFCPAAASRQQERGEANRESGSGAAASAAATCRRHIDTAMIAACLPAAPGGERRQKFGAVLDPSFSVE